MKSSIVVPLDPRGEPASVSFGFLHWPFATGQAKATTVTYHNDGDAALPLTLAVTASNPAGAPAATGAFTVDSTAITVPAHGTKDVTLTERPEVLGTATVGSFSGRLVASGPGGVVVQTAFGVTTERESFDVNVRLIDRKRPAGR